MTVTVATIAAPATEPWVLPSKGRVGMLCLIVAESAVFVIFVVAYLYYLGQSLSGPLPADVLELPIFISICLLASSPTISAAVRALEHGRDGGVQALVARDDRPGADLSRRYGARMVPADLRARAHDPDQPVRHDLLFAGRTARVARDFRAWWRSRWSWCSRGSATCAASMPSARTCIAMYWHFVDVCGSSCSRWSTSSGVEITVQVKPDTKDRRDLENHGMDDTHGSESTTPSVVLPAPTAYPMALSLGVTLLFAGLLTHVAISILGAVVMVAAAIGWFREVLPHEQHEAVPLEPEPPAVGVCPAPGGAPRGWRARAPRTPPDRDLSRVGRPERRARRKRGDGRAGDSLRPHLLPEPLVSHQPAGRRRLRTRDELQHGGDCRLSPDAIRDRVGDPPGDLGARGAALRGDAADVPAAADSARRHHRAGDVDRD